MSVKIIYHSMLRLKLLKKTGGIVRQKTLLYVSKDHLPFDTKTKTVEKDRWYKRDNVNL